MPPNRSPFVRDVANYRIKAQSAGDVDVFLYDEIGFWGVQAEQFARDLAAIEADTIHLRINSPGGDVFDGMAMIQALTRHPARVVAHVDGLAASMASVIAVSADELRMADGSFLMIHDPFTIAMGNADEFRRVADRLDKVGESIVAAYTRKTMRKKAEIEDLMAEETWLNAQEALEMGFADAVDSVEPVAAAFDLSVFNNVPEPVKGEKGRPTRRELEKTLRQAGFSRSEASAFVAGGLRTINPRQADEPSHDAATLAKIAALLQS